MIPQQLTLSEIQAAFREVQRLLDSLTGKQNIDLRGRRVIGAGKAIGPHDYVTKTDVDQAIENIQPSAAASTAPVTSGPLATLSSVRIGTYAVRGAAAAHPNELFLASDRDYIGFGSTGAIWAFAFGIHRDTFANRPTPTADEINYAYFATDTFQVFYWDGAAWIEEIAPALLPFLGLTTSFPALKRSAAKLQVRLADDSAAANLEAAVLSTGAGTKTAPGHSFTADADTGLYNGAANTLSITCGDTDVAAFIATALSMVSSMNINWNGAADTKLSRPAGNTFAIDLNSTNILTLTATALALASGVVIGWNSDTFIKRLSALAIQLSCPSSAPTLNANNSYALYLDEGGSNLKIVTKDSGGNVKTGTVAIV